jgi:hypothetical protein
LFWQPLSWQVVMARCVARQHWSTRPEASEPKKTPRPLQKGAQSEHERGASFQSALTGSRHSSLHQAMSATRRAAMSSARTKGILALAGVEAEVLRLRADTRADVPELAVM